VEWDEKAEKVHEALCTFNEPVVLVETALLNSRFLGLLVDIGIHNCE